MGVFQPPTNHSVIEGLDWFVLAAGRRAVCDRYIGFRGVGWRLKIESYHIAAVVESFSG